MASHEIVRRRKPMRARRKMAGWAGLTVAAIVVGALAVATARMEAAKEKTPDGEALYVAYCASCHGRGGRGDGPVADYLKIPPADLTSIARRASGVFSAYQVGRIIDGRQIVRAHGDAAMPVWGDAFKILSPGISEAEVRARIDALVKYLEAMQPRQASNTGAAPVVAR
jgi:mono/diheme cytochrome c family protein